jgi:hypothetical protein
VIKITGREAMAVLVGVLGISGVDIAINQVILKRIISPKRKLIPRKDKTITLEERAVSYLIPRLLITNSLFNL